MGAALALGLLQVSLYYLQSFDQLLMPMEIHLHWFP
jgi:hypothetical protein